MRSAPFSLAANVSTTSATARGLWANTSYWLRVVAWNRHGRSPPGLPGARLSTGAAETPAAPTDLALDLLGWPQSSVLSWAAPLELGGRPLQQYQVSAMSEQDELVLWQRE
ncbi:unnamed protein product [Effrenium voratum]|nr:unnamed protein product [Effrenium voratum]